MDEKCSKTPPVNSETSQKLDTEDQNEIEKKKGWALLIYDLKQRKLIPIKILSLIVYSSKSIYKVSDDLTKQFFKKIVGLIKITTGYGVLFPYIAIHMKSLGISVKETGVIYSVCALLGVFIPICVGIVADKLGNFKVA
jgi:fucose permease